MPGACDKVSIAANVDEQKRVVLCTQKELYQSSKESTQGLKLDLLHLQH